MKDLRGSRAGLAAGGVGNEVGAVGRGQRIRDASPSQVRYARRRQAGSCQSCGAEAAPQRTRCLPCGQKNAALAKAHWPLRKGRR